MSLQGDLSTTAQLQLISYFGLLCIDTRTQGAACLVMDLREGRVNDDCTRFLKTQGGNKALLDCSASLVKTCAAADQTMFTGQCLADPTLRGALEDRCVDIAYGMGVQLDLRLHPDAPADSTPQGLDNIVGGALPDQIGDTALLFVVWALLLAGAFLYKHSAFCRSWLSIPSPKKVDPPKRLTARVVPEGAPSSRGTGRGSNSSSTTTTTTTTEQEEENEVELTPTAVLSTGPGGYPGVLVRSSRSAGKSDWTGDPGQFEFEAL